LDALDQFIRFQLLQGVGQGCIGNGFENFFQFPKPHGTLDAQFIENLEFPFALQHLNYRRDRAVSLAG